MARDCYRGDDDVTWNQMVLRAAMGKLTGLRSRDKGVVAATKFVDILNHRGRGNDPDEQVGRMINISAEKQQHDAEWGAEEGMGRIFEACQQFVTATARCRSCASPSCKASRRPRQQQKSAAAAAATTRKGPKGERGEERVDRHGHDTSESCFGA